MSRKTHAAVAAIIERDNINNIFAGKRIPVDMPVRLNT